MAFAAWVRDRLRSADNWCAELAQLRQALATERRTAATIERTFEIASATEYCDPDRGRALALYLDAWRAGHRAAGERAKHLAGELRAHLTLAEITNAEGEWLSAANAFLDAGFRELAVAPLKKFLDARPPGASAVTETVRTEGVAALLALASGRRFDAEAEIASGLARARHATGQAAAAAYAHATRIARLARLDDQVASILAAATHACPDDDAIAALVEARLIEGGKTDELLACFSERLERCRTPARYAETARAAGVQLIAQNLQPGLGLRLLRMGLEHAYTAALPAITSHLAAWELLLTHAAAQRSMIELMPLLDQALAAPLPEDDTLYLARLGLEITWRHASDGAGAKPYATRVLRAVPDHPLAMAFVTEAAPEMKTDDRDDPLPPLDLGPPPPIPSPASRPVPAMPRIPALEGQILRASAPPSAAKKPHVASRVALLTRPAPAPLAPQATPPAPMPLSPPLIASSSPPQEAPAPATLRGPTVPPRAPAPTYPPRAPRKVVPVDAVVELADGNFFSTVLRDVSASGAFIVTKRLLEVGSLVTLEMKVPTPGGCSQVSHRVNARIARRTELGCGLAFVDATGELSAAILALTEPAAG